jgi:hypothetical protein
MIAPKVKFSVGLTQILLFVECYRLSYGQQTTHGLFFIL